jgi:hypothetical protein
MSDEQYDLLAAIIRGAQLRRPTDERQRDEKAQADHRRLDDGSGNSAGPGEAVAAAAGNDVGSAGIVAR